MLAQATMAYLFDPNVSTVGDAFDSVNWWQVGRSSAEGLIPWRTPGGKIGKAAATAVGDVLVNAIDAGSSYSKDQAMQDFAVGFIGDLAGGGLGDLVNKYGADAVAKGLKKIGFDDAKIKSLTGVSTKTHGHHSDPKFMGGENKQPLTKIIDTDHKALHKDMNDFLKNETDEFGNHMRPQRGNSGAVIRDNFSRGERLDALSRFYKGEGAKYKQAAKDFFSQHPDLK